MTVDYKMCRLARADGKVKVYVYSNGEWFRIFKDYEINKVENAKLLIDHHLNKKG